MFLPQVLGLAALAVTCTALPYSQFKEHDVPYPKLAVRQIDNSTSTVAPAASSTPTSEPTAGPEWHVTVNVGSSSFNIGDYDASQFTGLIAKPCSPNGCDGGSPQAFDFKGISSGQVEDGSGSVTLSGFVDKNQVITDDLLAAMGAAWQASVSCEEKTAQYCPPFDKRDPLGGPVPCDNNYKINQCTMANYVSATMYDDSSDVKGNIVLSASSHVDSPGLFDCASFLSAMSGAATAASLNPVIIGGTVIASVICGVAG